MGFVTKVMDGLQSIVASLGTERDKAATVFYAAPNWTDEQLVNAYRSAWLPRKIVEVPAFDSCRKWRNWQAEADQIEKIEAEERRLGVKAKVLEARIKARLFGGAAIYIGVSDPRPEEPLDVESIGAGKIKHLTVLSRRQLIAGDIENDPLSPFYGRPKNYKLATTGGLGQVMIHPSRLVLFYGVPHLDDDLSIGTNAGWGDSVLLSTMQAIKQADGTAANIASLVFEAKIDIFKIPDFMSKLGDPEYETRLMKRWSLAAAAKGNNGALLIDKDEEYEQKTMSFATLPDVLNAFMQLVSGAADIPATRLFGQAPSGLNSSGDSDLRNYYDRVSAGQELEMQPAMLNLDECLIRSALGARPSEVHYIWASLWQTSDKERAEIGRIDAETIAKLVDTNLFPQEALAKSGANMLIEHSVLPGFEAAIEEAGGLPDYEADLSAATATKEPALPEEAQKPVTDWSGSGEEVR